MATTLRASAPWEWRSGLSAAGEKLARAAGGWAPHPALDVDTHGVQAALAQAIEERWLQHPCSHAVLVSHDRGRLTRDVQLVLWVAAHTETDIRFELRSGVWVWSPEGVARLEPGVHDRHVAVELGMSGAGETPLLDLESGTLAEPLDGSWAASPPADAETFGRLRREVATFLGATEQLATHLPAAYEWICDTTAVVIPLRGEGPGFRSSSWPYIPGAVALDLLGGTVQVHEALVHESAHLQLFRAEAAGPLVDPAHEGRYSSPLRADPRPLRGILLAFHALSYICAYYAAAMDVGVADARRHGEDVAVLQAKRAEADAVLERGWSHLTETGREFVSRTRTIGDDDAL